MMNFFTSKNTHPGFVFSSVLIYTIHSSALEKNPQPKIFYLLNFILFLFFMKIVVS